MKIKRNRLFVFLRLILMVFVTMSLGAVEEVVPFEENIDSLTERLTLTGEQVERVKKIFNLESSQAKIDRQTYADTALALIQAAGKRRHICDGHIDAILNEEQLQEYREIKKERKDREELFELKEGLLLTEAQTRQVAHVLDEFMRKHGNFEPGKMNDRQPGGGMRGGGMKGGGMRGGAGGMGGAGMKGGDSGMGGGRSTMTVGRSNPMLEMWKKREAKKAKSIKKFLTKDQKELYKQIRKYKTKQMKKKFKEMQEKMGMGRRR